MCRFISRRFSTKLQHTSTEAWGEARWKGRMQCHSPKQTLFRKVKCIHNKSCWTRIFHDWIQTTFPRHLMHPRMQEIWQRNATFYYNSTANKSQHSNSLAVLLICWNIFNVSIDGFQSNNIPTFDSSSNNNNETCMCVVGLLCGA